MDANTFIHAKEHYYPIARFPEFWDWIIYQSGMNNIKIPREIYQEINGSRQSSINQDELAKWVQRVDVKELLLLSEDVDYKLVNEVIVSGYLSSPTESDLIKMGRDPFLIAYALKDKNNRTVVTTEVSKPSKSGSNRHVPDVCKELGIKCINTFQLIKNLDFSTSWKETI